MNHDILQVKIFETAEDFEVDPETKVVNSNRNNVFIIPVFH